MYLQLRFVTDLTAYPGGSITYLSARQVHSLYSASYIPLWQQGLLLVSQHIKLLVGMQHKTAQQI